MSDNPSLSPKVLKRYKALYSGVFYERFVLGKWTAQSGVVYPMFDYRRHTFTVPPICSRFAVSCDYERSTRPHSGFGEKAAAYGIGLRSTISTQKPRGGSAPMKSITPLLKSL